MTRRLLVRRGGRHYNAGCEKCEICSAPATVFLTQIINGKSTKFCLCAKCAQERGLLDPDAFDLAEKLFPNLQGQFGKEGAADPAAPIPALQSLPLTSCPICSFTLQDYKNVGRLGCSECYNVFEEEILPLLTQIQPDSHHHGKRPNGRKSAKRKPIPSVIWNNNFPWQWQERIMNARPSSAIKSSNCARRPINVHAL